MPPPASPPAPPGYARTIALVGMMGAGKSTVGRRLANRLGLPFVDADEEIERAAAMRVAEIFERHGEAGFRDGERRVIQRLIDGAAKVIATGGGAFIDPATRALLLAETITIWLDADAATLAERATRRGGRPLLDDRDPVATLTELATARNPSYALARLHVRSDDRTHDAIVDAIIKRLPQ